LSPNLATVAENGDYIASVDRTLGGYIVNVGADGLIGGLFSKLSLPGCPVAIGDVYSPMKAENTQLQKTEWCGYCTV